MHQPSKKIELTLAQISEIAEHLDMGEYRCFYYFTDKEVVTIWSEEAIEFNEDEQMAEMQRQIEENMEDFFEFEKMDSRRSFRVMQGFAEEVPDRKLQNKLFDALEGSKPFKNFRWIIDNSGDYRDEWFKYKKNAEIEAIKRQIDMHNEEGDFADEEEE